MRELLRRGGVRGRLIALVVGLLVAALAVTGFFAYRGTGSELRRAVDDDLREDAAAFSTQAVPKAARRPATIAASVRRYIATQTAFGASARLFVVRVGGGPVVTNEPELVRVGGDDTADAIRIRNAPLGYATLDLHEAGKTRLLTRPIVRGTRRVATVSVGESLASVQLAQDGDAEAIDRWLYRNYPTWEQAMITTLRLWLDVARDWAAS